MRAKMHWSVIKGRKVWILWAVLLGVAAFWLATAHPWRASKNCLSLDECWSINDSVHQMIAYGAGPQVKGRNPSEKEILAAGEGHCGMYVYLFCKELSRRGAEGVVYDLHTYDSPSHSHSVVEVETDKGRMVFDPTYGVVYRSDLENLLACGNAREFLRGTPSGPNITCYLENRFWAEIAQTAAYLNICDVYDLNLTQYAAAKSSANLPQIEMPAVLSVIQDKTLAENSVLTVFAKEEEFYRIKARFKERLAEPLIVECRIRDSRGEEKIRSGRVTQKAYSLEFQLDDPALAQSVQITFLQGKKPLPPLAYYDIYQ